MNSLHLQIALDKWEKVKRGETVISNSNEQDILSEHFNFRDDEDANLFFNKAVTIHNPERVGILDQYRFFIIKDNLDLETEE